MREWEEEEREEKGAWGRVRRGTGRERECIERSEGEERAIGVGKGGGRAEQWE